jgi:glycine C-acetyltransferase/8-amino-7-oxononanoate synthase
MDDWRATGLARRLRVADGQGVRLRVDGRDVISFASNDYLGLSQHPRVKAAACAALEAHGAGATASRLICGTRPEHAELEAALARFKGSESCLVFASGYQTPLALLPALTGEAPCAIVLDRLAHACLVDGARLSSARVRTFRHNNPKDLAAVLEKEAAHADGRLLLVAIESLYSMDGDVAPLAEIHAVAHRFGAWLLVDEAHATGVLGPGGRGALSEIFAQALPDDVLAMGTLSKALGSQGGYLCASRRVTDLLVHAGRAFLFSTGLAPAAAAAAREALRLIEADDGLRMRLLEKSAALRERLRTAGWDVLGGPGPILPLVVGDERRAVELAEALMDRGFWVPAIRYPTVKRGAARLRVSLSVAHEDAEIDGLVQALALGQKTNR